MNIARALYKNHSNMLAITFQDTINFNKTCIPLMYLFWIVFSHKSKLKISTFQNSAGHRFCISNLQAD
jgi:hypothetical protein